MLGTFALIKPDAIERRAVGSIISMIEAMQFKIRGLKLEQLNGEDIDFLYEAHLDKPWYEELRLFTQSKPCVLLALSTVSTGIVAADLWRQLMGATDSRKALPGTIRALYGNKEGDVKRNCVHGSDSAVSAERELKYFFPELL